MHSIFHFTIFPESPAEKNPLTDFDNFNLNANFAAYHLPGRAQHTPVHLDRYHAAFGRDKSEHWFHYKSTADVSHPTVNS